MGECLGNCKDDHNFDLFVVLGCTHNFHSEIASKFHKQMASDTELNVKFRNRNTEIVFSCKTSSNNLYLHLRKLIFTVYVKIFLY